MDNPSIKTFSYKPRKKAGLWLGAILSLIIALVAFRLFLQLKVGEGKTIIFVLGLCALGIFFFVLRALAVLTRDKFIGMYISDDGLFDDSTGHRVGMIFWHDVTEIKKIPELGSKSRYYIVLKLRNPNDYINREIVGAKRKSLILKYNYYGSPICFSNRALNCSFDELYNVVNNFYEKYKQNNHHRSS